MIHPMKLMKRSLCAPAKLAATVALAGLSFLSSAHAELAHPVKPLLWKIEGPAMKAPSYLFGTIHVGKGPVATLHPVADKAFKESKSLHTEAPFDAATQAGAVALVMRKDGKTLAQSIGADLAKQLNGELKRINPALDATPFQPLETWYVAIMLPMLPLQLDGTKPLDMLLWDRATEDGKKTAGMQTTAEQLAGFKDFNEAEQVLLLKETLHFLEKERDEGKDSLKDLVDAYITGDPAKVEAECEKSLKLMTEGENKELGERLIKRILHDRDVIMADYIDETLKKDPDGMHFFAAGAAHYTGKAGVRSYLEKKGYKITRIEP
jgi:uncharacterized protein YbaP (TraB family)